MFYRHRKEGRGERLPLTGASPARSLRSPVSVGISAMEQGFPRSGYLPAGEGTSEFCKNDGVTATIELTPGAIGYIEYGYTKVTKLTPSACISSKEV